MKYISIIVWGLIIMAGNVFAEIVTENVEYHDKDALLEGYLAYDNTITQPMPVVIVVHEWTGITDYVKMRCKKLAELGYLAFAADIYGKGKKPETMDEARTQATMYKSNIPLLRERIITALEKIKQNEKADIGRIAAIGYCFGGSTVLELARSGQSIQCVVSFHGGLSTPNIEDAKGIKCKVLVLHGADDPYVKPEEVTSFENEMRLAKVDWQLVKYSGAVHSFTNPASGNDNSKGAAYNEKADKRSWEAMRLFLNEIFNQ